MTGLKDRFLGQNSGVALLIGCANSSVLLKSWKLIPFVTWRDAAESVSG